MKKIVSEKNSPRRWRKIVGAGLARQIQMAGGLASARSKYRINTPHDLKHQEPRNKIQTMTKNQITIQKKEFSMLGEVNHRGGGTKSFLRGVSEAKWGAGICFFVFLSLCFSVSQAHAVSARRMPTAYVVHTYGDATRDYQEGELSTWEALTDINCTAVTTTDQDSSGTTLYVADTTVFENCELNRSTVSCDGQVLTITAVSAGVSLTVSAITGTITSGTDVKAGFVLECYDDDAPYTDSILVAGATNTSSNYFRIIKAASGHEGTPTSGVRFEKLTVGAATVVLQSAEDYASFYDIAAKITSTVNSAHVYAFRFTKTGCHVVGCTAYDVTASGVNTRAVGFFIAGGAAGATQTNYAIDCFVYNISGTSTTATAGFYQEAVGGALSTTYVYNCTVNTSNYYGISLVTSAGTNHCYYKNCILQSCSGGATYSSGTNNNFHSTTNVTSGVTFDADGYHITNDPQAVDQGTDLSGDGVFAFDDDIDGETRGGTWDVGCDEYGLLAAPTGVSATDGTHEDKVTVSWNAVGAATGYEVWRNTVDDSASASRIKDANGTTSYDDETVTVDVTYYYWVKTESAEGESEFSSSDSGYAEVAAPSPPGAPGRDVVIKGGVRIKGGVHIVNDG